MGISSSSLVSWAAKEGRVDDLIYHLNCSDKVALKPAVGSTKNRSPLHLAAIGGHTQCISILYDAGKLHILRDITLHSAAATRSRVCKLSVILLAQFFTVQGLV